MAGVSLTIMLIGWIFFAGFFLLFTVYEILRYKISPYPSNHHVESEVIQFLKNSPQIKKIGDLGAGFGFFSVKLAKIFPEKEILAVEATVFPFYVLRFLKSYYQLENLKIKKIDFFKMEKIDVDCVYCFLYPDKMDKIAKHLKKVLKQKVLVISSTFYLNLPLINQKRMSDVYQTPVYYYKLS